MKKQILDFRVCENSKLHGSYSLLRLTPANGEKLPDSVPGQFVQVKIDGSPTTFLRRPISINYVDAANNELWLLVRRAGDGTAHLMAMAEEETVNLIIPLGNGFTMPEKTDERILLIGGGVGVAPLLQLGKTMKENGFRPEFLLGARTADDILEQEMFQRFGNVHISTDNGSAGSKGVVTENPVLGEKWDRIYCCGPAPMMKAVAALARDRNIWCEVSLENMMACGVGACLCCVEKTVRGNVCVCTEGSVFNINDLTW